MTQNENLKRKLKRYKLCVINIFVSSSVKTMIKYVDQRKKIIQIQMQCIHSWKKVQIQHFLHVEKC